MNASVLHPEKFNLECAPHTGEISFNFHPEDMELMRSIISQLTENIGVDEIVNFTFNDGHTWAWIYELGFAGSCIEAIYVYDGDTKVDRLLVD